MSSFIAWFDRFSIHFLRRISVPLARIALFVVYFWFGFLKVLGTSPANPLVSDLLQQTLPFITFNQFIVALGLFEMLIGLLFLLPGYERLAVAFLIPHLATTVAPLVLLPSVTWQSFLVPTLEGQYILKNITIIALAFSLASHLRPFYKREEY